MRRIIEIFKDLKTLKYVTISGNTNRLGDYILKVQKEAYNQALEDAYRKAKIIYVNQETDYGGPIVDKQSILKLKK